MTLDEFIQALQDLKTKSGFTGDIRIVDEQGNPFTDDIPMLMDHDTNELVLAKEWT